MSAEIFPINKTEEEWAAELSADQYRVLREHGTERPGTSPLSDEKREGILPAQGGVSRCSTNHQYESCSGWPSFFSPLDERRPRLKTAAIPWFEPKSTARGAVDIWVMFFPTALVRPAFASYERRRPAVQAGGYAESILIREVNGAW